MTIVPFLYRETSDILLRVQLPTYYVPTEQQVWVRKLDRDWLCIPASWQWASDKALCFSTWLPATSLLLRLGWARLWPVNPFLLHTTHPRTVAKSEPTSLLSFSYCLPPALHSLFIICTNHFQSIVIYHFNYSLGICGLATLIAV